MMTPWSRHPQGWSGAGGRTNRGAGQGSRHHHPPQGEPAPEKDSSSWNANSSQTRAPGRGSLNCEPASCGWSWVGGTEGGSRCDTRFSVLMLLLCLNSSEAHSLVGQLSTLHCKPPSVWTSSHFLSTPGVCNGVSTMLSTQKKRKLVKHKQPLPRSLHSCTDFQKQSPEDCLGWGTRGLITDASRVGLAPFQGAKALQPPAECQAYSQDTSKDGRVRGYQQDALALSPLSGSSGDS